MFLKATSAYLKFMEVIIILAPFTIILALIFLIMFFRSNDSGQFNNLESESYKILIEDNKQDDKEGQSR